VSIEDTLDKRRYSSTTPVIDSIPSSPASSEDLEYKVWKKTILAVHNKLSFVKYASIFLRPVPEEQAAEYKNIIYRPMDLQTIKKNIENGTIRTTAEYQRDVMQMCQNAIMFSRKDIHTEMMASDMMQESVLIIESAFENSKVAKTEKDEKGSISSASKRGLKKTRSSSSRKSEIKPETSSTPKNG
jgi:bromodomain-containing protein 8